LYGTSKHTFHAQQIFFLKAVRLSDNEQKCGTAMQATDDNIIRRMRIVCSKTKATNTHSEYVTIIAFLWQKWLCERASMLRYMYIACIVGLKETLEKSLVTADYSISGWKFPKIIGG